MGDRLLAGEPGGNVGGNATRWRGSRSVSEPQVKSVHPCSDVSARPAARMGAKLVIAGVEEQPATRGHRTRSGTEITLWPEVAPRVRHEPRLPVRRRVRCRAPLQAWP